MKVGQSHYAVSLGDFYHAVEERTGITTPVCIREQLILTANHKRFDDTLSKIIVDIKITCFR